MAERKADEASQNVEPSPKRRFHRAAMQILSQVVQQRILEEETPESVEEHHQTKTGHPNAKSTPRPPKRQSLANIARIYSLKKMSRLPGAKSQLLNKNKLLNQAIIEDEFELPTNPRFCATLSPEAQYAMMKCYDDILVENITHSFPEIKVTKSRVKTPTNAKIELPDHMANTSGGKQPVRRSVAGYKSEDKTGNSHKDKTERNRFSEKLKVKNPTSLSKETQLRLTGRFERAMDILDTIRESEGKIVTSHRYKSRDIKPLRHYNSWSNDWAKEFKFESKT